MVPLTPKVIETLMVLVENRHRVVSEDEFMKKLRPDSLVEESNLNQNVFVLRKALGDSQQSQPKHVLLRYGPFPLRRKQLRLRKIYRGDGFGTCVILLQEGSAMQETKVSLF